ncbi:hypothetical protein NDU88_004853 [Pleurodeles waltl]|uniref:Uncharacterized protein n=1 Tax=Pleurodeles waltl TaxID=8319 RepID=A0AAV7TUX5_PLEWA|nr:hypothetical protein NDU88_004853 [Pleurodeles waltl]
MRRLGRGDRPTIISVSLPLGSFPLSPTRVGLWPLAYAFTVSREVARSVTCTQEALRVLGKYVTPLTNWPFPFTRARRRSGAPAFPLALHRLAPPPESPALPATQVCSPQAARLHVNPWLPGSGQAASSRGLRLSLDPPVSTQGGPAALPLTPSGSPAMQLQDASGLGSVSVEKLKAPPERQNQACAIFSRVATPPTV